MSSPTVKQTLLKQLDNFINELATLFSTNNEILILKEKYFMLKNINSNVIVDYLVDFVYPFKKQILEKNEDFFLQGGGQDNITDEGGLKFKDNIVLLSIFEILLLYSTNN